MPVRSARVLATSIVLFVPFFAFSGQGSVYGPSAPGDSAFVRVVNAAPGAQSLVVSLGATRFDALKYAEVSPYRPVIPDIYLVRAFGNQMELVAKTKTYFTIVCTSKSILILEDATHVDPARAQIFLYNLSSVPSLDLKSSDGKTILIAGVKSGSSSVKVVNAVAASLAVFAGSSRVKQLGDLGLARGSSFSVFAFGDAASPTVLVVKAEVRVK